MKYHGNNPLGLALAADADGTVRDALLRTLHDHQWAAEHSMASASTPSTYQRQLSAAECAAACVEVVKEFHAVCFGASAEQTGSALGRAERNLQQLPTSRSSHG
jgi:hypothetical protein